MNKCWRASSKFAESPSCRVVCNLQNEQLSTSLRESSAMLKQTSPAPQRRHPSYRQAFFRLSPLAALIAAAFALNAGPLHAAEPTVAELQAEIARLKQIIAQQAASSGQAAASSAATQAKGEGQATEVKEADKEADREESQTLGEVTVRSRNRIERLQDVPLSVSVVTGKELDKLVATDIKSIAQRVGNVTWNQGNQRSSSLSIRGIGKQGQTEAQDPSVGLIVDGVNYAYNALSSSYDFTDVEAVEVTRGPQGTLLGKNTSVGVVNVVTRKPSFTPDASWSLTLGKNDTVIGQFAAGGALVDGLLAYRAALSVSKGAGDIENANNRDITFTNKDRASGRVQFLLTPTTDFSARIAFDLQPRAGETTNNRIINIPTPATFSNGSTNTLSTDPAVRLNRRWFTQDTNYSYANDFLYGGGRNEVNYDNQRAIVTGSKGASAELNWNLGSHTLTSITAWKSYHFDAVNDEGTPFDIQRNNGGFWNDYKQVSQELRISSQPGRLVDYQAGLFLLKVDNAAEYRKEWGNDAGAWYASPNQYARLDADAAGRLLMQNSLDRLSMDFNSPAGFQDIRNKSAAVFGQADWHLSDPLTLTTGVRFTREERRNAGYSLIKSNGFGAELNPVSVNGVPLGGFASDNLGALGAGNSTTQLSLADKVANRYFGTAITATPGAAYNSLTATQKRQVADAKSIRVSQIGVIFNRTDAEPFKDTLPAFVISPSYKINDNLTTYASWQYGEKAGISQLTNGVSNLVKAEKTNALELGFKSALFNRALILNADIYVMNIRDYQQAVRVLDVYTTTLNNDGTNYYTTATGNVPKVQAKGLEVDGVYNGIRNTTIRFSGAYNDARYKNFPNSAQPLENGYAGAPAYQDVSGQSLPGAARLSFNVGVDYRLPVWNDKEFHTTFNTAYTSKFNSDTSLSSYGWIPASNITDLALGIGNRKQSFDVSFLVKNLFNDDTPLLRTWNTYTPAVPRWYGVVFSGKL
jgi:iron complex outermembrane recepter protein